MEHYELVYETICRLGGARLDRITTECRKSQSTVSRAIKELETDYMIRREKNIWFPSSAVARKVSQPAKSGEVSQDRSLALRRDDGKTASRNGLPDGIPAAFCLDESENPSPAPLGGLREAKEWWLRIRIYRR